MAKEIRIQFHGNEYETQVEGLGIFFRGHPRTFSGEQYDLAKKLTDTNFNFNEAPLEDAKSKGE